MSRSNLLSKLLVFDTISIGSRSNFERVPMGGHQHRQSRRRNIDIASNMHRTRSLQFRHVQSRRRNSQSMIFRCNFDNILITPFSECLVARLVLCATRPYHDLAARDGPLPARGNAAARGGGRRHCLRRCVRRRVPAAPSRTAIRTFRSGLRLTSLAGVPAAHWFILYKAPTPGCIR